MTRNATQNALFGGTATQNNRKPKQPKRISRKLTGRGKQGLQVDRLFEDKPEPKAVNMGRWQVKQRLAI